MRIPNVIYKLKATRILFFICSYSFRSVRSSCHRCATGSHVINSILQQKKNQYVCISLQRRDQCFWVLHENLVK